MFKSKPKNNVKICLCSSHQLRFGTGCTCGANENKDERFPIKHQDQDMDFNTWKKLYGKQG